MTHENIFKEVEEDLERQRLEALWKRYGPFVVAAALAIVVGTAGFNVWQTHTSQMHQKATGELIEIVGLAKTDDAKQIEALESFARTNQGQAQAVFARLHAAALAAKQDNKDQAIRMYDAVVADAKADPAFRQLADLLSIELQIDSGDAAALQKRLQPLMAEDAPWRFSAREYSGYLAFRVGDRIKAKELFTELSQDADVPQSIAARATDMMRVLAE